MRPQNEGDDGERDEHQIYGLRPYAVQAAMRAM